MNTIFFIRPVKRSYCHSILNPTNSSFGKIHELRYCMLLNYTHTPMEDVWRPQLFWSPEKRRSDEGANFCRHPLRRFCWQGWNHHQRWRQPGPYTIEQIASISFTTVEKSGIYYEAVRVWRRKMATTKTWDHFNFLLIASSMISAQSPALRQQKSTRIIASLEDRQMQRYSKNNRSLIPPPWPL